MKKILLSLAALALSVPAFAATGDVKVIVDQVFSDTTALTSSKTMMWGEDIKNMITKDGLYMTNNNDASQNYAGLDFLTFKSAQGKASQELNISYKLFNPKGFGQDPAYYEINYYNNKSKFVFGIKESIGGWAYKVSIVTATENGELVETPLPVEHVKQNIVSPVEYNVKFSGNNAIIEIDGGSYAAYTASAGIQFIKLAVSGNKDWSRGMYLQNYVLKTTEIEAIETAKYTVKYVVGDKVINEVEKSGVVGSDIVLNDSEMAPLWNEDHTEKYIYVSNDAEGKTVDAEGTTVVTLNYRVADTWNYTVKNNVNDNVIDGTCIEGESATVPFSIYALTTDGTVWMKKYSTNPWFAATFTPDANNYVENIVYEETDMKNGLFFIEAEELPGLTKTTDANADIRCSNQAGGYIAVAEGEEAKPVEICKLTAGTYKVHTAIRGGAGTTITIKSGNDAVLEMTTDGNWSQGESEEFTIDEETSLTVEGPTKSRFVDYFLITGNGKTSAVAAVEAVNADNNWYNLQGVKIAQPTQAGLYIHNGKKIIVK